MEERDFVKTATVVFCLLALVHFVRALFRFEMSIGTTDVAVWFSWLAFIVFSYLWYTGVHITER